MRSELRRSLRTMAKEVTDPADPISVPPLREPVRARQPSTVVFADVVDSTALGELLDPESVHRILERFSGIARTILGRHGGEIEKFIGDAVVAFFGLTELHEDDALRAVRAAVELRDAVAALSDELVQSSGIEFAISIGVNSGDIFVGGGEGREIFATGDSVNVAARLEQGAEPWEILLGDRTYRLVEPDVASGTAGAVRSQGPVGVRAGVEAARLGRSRTGRGASDGTFRRPGARARPIREAFARSRDATDVQALHDRRAGGNREDSHRARAGRGSQRGSDRGHRPLPFVRGGHHLPPVDRDRSAARRRGH